jgi:hypothetical protein
MKTETELHQRWPAPNDLMGRYGGLDAKSDGPNSALIKYLYQTIGDDYASSNEIQRNIMASAPWPAARITGE